MYFLRKCQCASVDIHTVFKNPDIYVFRVSFVEICDTKILKFKTSQVR